MMMKKQAATLLTLMLAGLTGLVNAQTSAIKAQVPFGFVANGKTMPAGECLIAVLVNGGTLLAIKSGTRQVFAVPIADQLWNPSKKTALVFRRYGDRYFLAGIKQAGRIGYELPPSKLERELRSTRTLAQEVFTLLASAN